MRASSTKTFYKTLPKKNKRKIFVRNYTKVRILCTESERLELDNLEGEYDFSVCSAIGLLLIDAYYSLSKISLENLEIKIGLLSLVIVLLLGIRFHNSESYSPLINSLISKYRGRQL